MLNLYRRHQPPCPYSTRRYRNCRCPIWVQGSLRGEYIRRALDLRSWSAATDLVRDREAAGEIGVVKKPDIPPIAEAVERFFDDLAAQKLSQETIRKYENLLRKRLLPWCECKGFRYLKQLTVEEVRQFRASWADGALYASKNLERLRAFFRFCMHGEEGLANCRFQEGDATDLNDLADRSFDLVVSIFGAMFAPKPFEVAKEMVRVTRPGGRIVMGNWIPGDPTLVAQILKISSAYSPPPPEGFVSPMTWGVESHVIDRFAAAGIPCERISLVKDTYTFNAPVAPAAFLADFRTYYGPTINAFAAAERSGTAANLQQELQALFERENRSGAKDAVSIPATFLRVTVAR